MRYVQWGVLLLQAERYGKCKLHTYRLATLLARLPFRHGIDHTKRLFIESWINTTDYLSIYNRTVSVHNKRTSNTSLNAVFLRYNGILN